LEWQDKFLYKRQVLLSGITKVETVWPYTFHRAHGVCLVHNDNIDIAKLEPCQGCPHWLDDVFPGETSLIWPTRNRTASHLLQHLDPRYRR